MPTINEVMQRMSEQNNAVAAMARKAMEDVAAMKGMLGGAVKAAVQEQMSKSLPGTRDALKYVDSIPGRRVPFDMLCLISIAADTPGPYSNSIYVTPDGYFIATHRYAAFMSSYVFQVSDQNAVATFNGRSNGRYRPVHSACDLMDAQGGWNPAVGSATPGTMVMQGEHTTNRSGFRTMEFDGTVEVTVRDSDYRRQNAPVPTSVWAPGLSSIQELPVPDVIRPGVTVDFNVQSNHINNPSAGNIQTIVGSLPYLDSQYDGHEGIGYTAPVGGGTDDAITRRPDGILVLGYLGYRILAPASTTA